MTKSKPSSVKLPEPGWAETKAAKTPATPPDRDGRDLTIDDLYELHLPGDPRVSPDRNTILTTVQTIDHDADEYRAALWIMDPDGSNQRRLSSGQWRDTAPRWSPNGNWIAFRSKRDGDDKIQLYVMPVNGGEPTRVTALEHGITDHCWSPDSRRLVVVSQVDMPDENASDSDSVRVITSAHYKFNGTGFRDDRFTHLFVVDRTRPDDDACQLTEGRFLHRSPAWSPDGRLIAFVANRDPNWDVSRVSDVWTIPANGGESRRLTDGEESWRHPAWSPDGAMLAVLGETQLGSTYTNTLLGLLPVSGGPLRTISASTDRAIGDSSMSAPRGDVSGPTMRWTPDGSAIDALVSDRGATRVVRFPTNDGKITALTGLNQHLMAFDHLAGGELVATVADATTPSELVRITPKKQSKITAFNQAWTSDVYLAQPEEIVTEVNGVPVQGWLLKPRDYTPDSKTPLVVNIHGGPHGQFSPAFFHELQLFAARGWGLLFINPRGSVGFGEAFAAEVSGAWGIADAQDFLGLLDHVLAQGGWDENRLGVTGGSYGGFMTNWLLGHSDRFRAAVTDRSICNMTSMYGTDDISLVSLDPELGTPWEYPDRFWELSPLRSVANITAPVLIIHSEEDYRCPMEQAEQLFIALKRLGRTVEFVRFAGENHELSRNGKPANRVERLERTLGWFDRHL